MNSPTNMKQVTMRNGVNVTRLKDTMEMIKEKPMLARFTFRNMNTWIDGGHNRSTIKDFYACGQEDTSRKAAFVFDNDEPDVLLGMDRGANPVEFVLHALAGCLTTTMVYYAAAMGIVIEEVESTYRGDLDIQGLLGLSSDVRNGYEKIDVMFKVKADAPMAKIEELMQLAMNHSPVFDCVSNPVPVNVRVERM